MTYLIKDIADHLKASPDIQNIFQGRVYPERAPQKPTYPFLVISEISITPEESLAGEIGTHRSIVEVAVWTDGSVRADANQGSEAVRNRLSGFKGQLGDGVTCNGCHLERSNTIPAELFPSSDQYRRRVNMQFLVIHSADVPTFA